MNSWQTLVDGIVDEDRILRRRLAAVQPAMRDKRGPDGTLSPKEMLAHVAFWDFFTVQFFEDKLAGRDPVPPDDFSRRSEQAIHDASGLSFAEVEAEYRAATDQLIAFLPLHWSELSAREQRDFWVPLKHRRHHRVALFRVLDELAPPEPGSELAAGA